MADKTAAVKLEDTREPREAASPDAPARKRVARKPKREPGRWVREAKGILALALAGFCFVALYAFDPALHPMDQSSHCCWRCTAPPPSCGRGSPPAGPPSAGSGCC